MSFAELSATTNFTFLTGASHPEEMVERAAELGLAAIAIADRNSVAGVVRAYARLKALAKEATPRAKTSVTGEDVRARARAIRMRMDPSSRLPAPDPLEPDAVADFTPRSLPRLIVGARLVFGDDRLEWTALPTDRAAYGRLCRMLTVGKQRAEKGGCILRPADLEEWGEGMILLAHPPEADRGEDFARAAQAIAAFARRFPDHVFTCAAPRHDGRDAARLHALAGLAAAADAPLVASARPLMHHARRRALADVLTCIRERRTVDALGALALPNAEQRLRSGAEMALLFRDHPEAVARTLAVADRCRFGLCQLTYEYPDEAMDGEDAQTRLERLTAEGLAWRYPSGVSERISATVEKELRLIRKLDYAPYFLTVRDIVAFARGRGILCQGRGSAANSVVCYALGVTEANPELISTVFERFVSEARGEPPDIDVDFEHERREEVIQHIYARYGRESAGLCATVIHFRARAALREVGRAMGLSGDMTAALASQVWGWSSEGVPQDRVREIGLDPNEPRLRRTLALTHALIGFPRHLSQHVGGFVITRQRLDEYVPIENAAMEDRTVIEWDKDDIDALGMMKVDVLALGMLTCLRKGFGLIASHGGPHLTLNTTPKEDPTVYDMLCTGDSLGVFQVESRAQMNFLPRMKPRRFYDLVIEVAIVRPGPIQGDMVHPYLRRREGKEPIDYVKPELEAILGKTLGVPLFQEQAMQIAMTAAEFTPDEADGLRRAMATFRKTGTIQNFGTLFIERMTARGYPPAFAERCFRQIEGFGEYGFPESHAASFALLVYASAWMKRHHPAAFACALLNSQPMGFYAPAQIVRDAREHGVEVRPVCVNASDWDCTLEAAPGGLALRTGFRQIRAMRETDARRIVAARGNGYVDVAGVQRRAGVGPAALTHLAEADAFAALGLARREALWAAQALAPRALPLFDGTIEGEGIVEPFVALPPMTEGEAVVEDYVALRLTMRTHPVALVRPALGKGIAHADILRTARTGAVLSIAGLVVTRQRPGTASGVIFLTLEDESGVANVVVWPRVYECFRRAVIAGRLLRVRGKLQREGIVTHLIASRIDDYSPLLDRLGDPDRAGAVDVLNGRADKAKRPVSNHQPPRPRHPREQAKALFPSRDFH